MNVTCAIVLVQDMARSVAFYRDVLGLPLRPVPDRPAGARWPEPFDQPWRRR